MWNIFKKKKNKSWWFFKNLNNRTTPVFVCRELGIGAFMASTLF
jgi:hypothetical protein